MIVAGTRPTKVEALPTPVCAASAAMYAGFGKKLAPTCVTLPKLSSQFVRFGPSSFPARRGAGGRCRRGRAKLFGKETHVRARRERAHARAHVHYSQS